MLTKSHHKIITSFMDFKERNDEMIKEREVIKQKWQYVERALALKSPVMEAEFAFDDCSALSLYDCLIPKIKAYRKLQIRPEIIVGADDFKAQSKVLQLEYELEQKRVPILTEENGRLKETVEQLRSEVAIVEWYLATMEDGIDTKELGKEYTLLKQKYKALDEKTYKQIKKLTAKLDKTKEDLIQVKALLKK